MDERGANIDLLFRNGLKDYEVLPPPEVWENIHPAIKVKTNAFIFIRAAALIGLVVTLSFLAYRWSREISIGHDSTITAFDIEAASPAFFPSYISLNTITVKERIPDILFNKSLFEDIPENTILSDNDKNSIPEIANFNGKNILTINRVSLQHGPVKSFEILTIDQQYVPEISPVKSTERWSIAAMASPTYYSSFNSGRDGLSKQLMASETPLVSYSGGVAVSYKINKRFSIQTGLYYSSLGQEVDGVSSFSGFKQYNNTKGNHNFEVLTTSGSIYAHNPDVFLIADGPGERILTTITNDVFDPKKANLQPINSTLLQNFSYLELPIVMKYKFIDKTIDFNLIGGISYGLLVNNSAYARVGGSKYPVGNTEGLNPITLSSSIGMGMEYNISNKLSLNFEPTFRYYLNPFNEVTGSKFHPYSLGVFSGLSYKF
mgnify:CR=1 FL=1